VFITKFCVTKFRRIILAEDVTQMGREKINTGFWWLDLKKRDHLDNLAIDGNTTLKLLLKK
jgi:hypothetical protein